MSSILKSNLLPPFVGIALTKSEFCYCVGITPYKLRCILRDNHTALARLGYSKYDKYLMPNVVLYLLDITKLQINVDLYYQVHKVYHG